MSSITTSPRQGARLSALSWIFGSSSGITDDLNQSPLANKDRTWALRKGFERNLRDRYCTKLWDKNSNIIAPWDSGMISPRLEKQPKNLTLGSLRVDPGNTPA